MTVQAEELRRYDLEYCEAVLAGDIVVGKLARLAVDRHLRDLETAHERGLYFDAQHAWDAVEFFPAFLRHFKGRGSAGHPFELSLWQAFIVSSLWGWRRERDGLRRFSEAFVGVARKNGKTHLLGGLGLLATFFDDEDGAEGYWAATKEDQALIGLEISKALVEGSPELRSELATLKKRIVDHKTRSFMAAVGRDSATLDGLNVSFAAIDEIHAHKDRGVYDVLDSATSGRLQPLVGIITTAGEHSPEKIGVLRWEYAVSVLQGSQDDDDFFAIIHSIDDDDDWEDEECWAKANPQLDITVQRRDLRRKARKARVEAGALHEFLTKHLNRWQTGVSRWVKMEEWRAMDELEQDLTPPAYAGIDIARIHDLSSLALFFPAAEPPHSCCAFHWIPDRSIDRRSKVDRVPYAAWRDQGLIEPTPGKTTDRDFIRRRVNEIRDSGVKIKAVAYDPHFADSLVAELEEDGFLMVKVSQTVPNLTVGCQELGRLIAAGDLAHGADPVLRWMAGNVVIRKNSEGYIKFDKEKSIERIDGMTALGMAVGIWQKLREEDQTSRYDDEDDDDLVVI